jgi:hypothetical protein
MGEFSPNFDLKNMISIYPKKFLAPKNGSNSPDFTKKKSKSIEFYDRFQWVAKNKEGSFL